MNFMPEYDFQKCINRHKGKDSVKKGTCREHFLHAENQKNNQKPVRRESAIIVEFS